MRVKRKKIDVDIERKILQGCVVSDRFLKEVKDLYKPEYMKMETSPIIMGWCIDYYEKYEKAPQAHIQDIFNKWARSNSNEEQATFIENFLDSLSEDYENSDKFNVDFLLDKTVEHFQKQSLLDLATCIKYAVEHENSVEEAEMMLAEHKRVEKLLLDDIDPFEDANAMMEAFESTSDPLFRLPGTLGKLMNDQFTRDSFISLMAPEKRGKTWMLKFISMCAYKDRCNVAVFQVGDMSQNQYIRRIGIHHARKSDKRKYCTNLWVPTRDCVRNQKNECRKTCKIGIYDTDNNVIPAQELKGYKPCCKCMKDEDGGYMPTTWKVRVPDEDPLTWREAFRYAKEFKKKVRGKSFKIITRPNKSINVQGIRNIIDTWERVDGFVPDVIVIDYADILAPEIGSKEFRHQQNDTWMALRSLSQIYHCCVITATQADAASYGQKSVKRGNFSEDKRKYAHATAMYALNQTDVEKAMGIMRIAPLIVREDAYNENYNVHMAQCLEQGQPCLFSW